MIMAAALLERPASEIERYAALARIWRRSLRHLLTHVDGHLHTAPVSCLLVAQQAEERARCFLSSTALWHLDQPSHPPVGLCIAHVG
jgi:hypothetical protein